MKWLAAGRNVLLLALLLALYRPAAAQQATAPAAAPPSAGTAPPPPVSELIPPDEHPGVTSGPPIADWCCTDTSQGHFTADAEYLLLQPRRRESDFVINDPTNNGLPQGAIQSVNWGTDSGVRAGGAYQFGDHGWEIGAYYTYFYDSASNTQVAGPNGILYATLTHPGFVDAVDSAIGLSSLKYQIADIEIGRHVTVDDSFKIWLSAGGRFAWINQTLDATYNGQSAFLDQVRSPINFYGAGVRVGAEGQWSIIHGLGLYAHAYGSLIDGDFQTSLSETNNAGAAVISNVSEHFYKVVPELELGIGVTYRWENISARVGYDIYDWIGLVDSPDFVHDYTNKLSHRMSDLSLDGLVVRLEVSY